jgi:hypothetical protein
MIDNIDLHTGYTTGGQNLTLTGYNLEGENIDIKVDGVPCIVT